MEVSEDADIEQLLALRNALMNQLNHTQATSSTSKQHSRSRRSSINKSCPAVQPSALSPTTFPPPPPSHHPKKRSKKRKISAQSKDDTASSSELKSNSDNSRPASNNINRQSPNQQTKPIENQCSKSNDADEISIDAEHIVNKQSEQSKTFPESKHNQAHDQPPASAQCPFLYSNSIPISFVKNDNNDTINATLNENNCDNTVNDTDMTKTGFTNDRKRVHCDDDDDDDDDSDDGNAIKNGKIRETESLLVDTSGGASTECVNAGTKELPEQPISSPKEHGNEKTPANEEHQGAAVEVHHAEDEDGLLPPPPPPPEINFSANENIKNEVGVSHDIIPPPPKPPGQNDMVDGVESPSTSYLQSTPQNNDEQNAEEDNEESVKETTFEEREITDDECEENIDSLLEKPFADGDKPGKIPIPEEGQMREKIVLAHRGVDYFDVLPEGWVELTHTSGLPVYLHKSSRVCTFSRPYFIGPSSVRHHHVPESAIPCLHQRRVLRDLDESAKLSADALQNALNMNSDMNESDNKNKSNDNLLNEEKAKLIATLQAPNTKVQTAEDFKAKQLEPKALHEYAKRVFKFKTIQVYRFQKWSATRTFHRQKKLAEAERLGKLAPSIEVPIGRPTLPGNVQLITVPAMEANLKPQHKGFFLNPQGKTSISILHEYVQKVLKSTINYQFTETRSSSTPYGCAARLKMNLNNRVMSAASIKEKLMLLQEKQRREANLKQQNGDSLDSEFVILGNGCGNSKKSAKLDAARSALKVLIPAIDFDADGIAISHKKEGEEAENEQEDAIALFDMLSIEDSRIPDLSLRAGQPSPYLLLQECLKRNAAYGDTEIKLSSERVRHQKHQFDMDVGKHRVSVECSNKREGKQKASQAMLKKLHPNLDTWGSLIRLYGNEAQQKQQEAKRSQRSIIKLQGNRDKEGSSMEPNQAILERLRAGMLNIENDKKRRKSNVTNEKEALIIRPKLSQTNALLNADEAVQESSEYAATHPDALSAFRIDL